MSDRQRGIIFMLASAVIFSLMAAMVRGVASVNPLIMVAARFAIGILVCLAIFATGRDRPRWTAWPWLLGRGVIGGIAVILLYWSIQNVGLAKAQMLSYTYVVFAAIMAVPVLGERLRPLQWAAVLAAMLGAVILCGVQSLTFRPADWIALLSGFLSGVAVICVARCRATDTSTNIFWSQAVFGLAIVAIPATRAWVMPTPTEWLWLLLIGVFASAGQLSMTYAYKHTGASQGSLISLIAPVMSATIGVLYFHEPYTGEFLIGSALIIGSCIYMALNPVAVAAKPVAECDVVAK
ncbi:MAG: DMT family transporter [Armatimonadetes bacterium]|nr:DMT family transporter [Armatimonadota bacterium]